MDRETLDVDVLIVGGGPAGLSAALRLAQLQKAAGGEPLSIAVLEKAREAGAHMLSGAVLDPSTLRDLIPDFEAKGAPLATPVREDRIYFLTRGGKLKFPIMPPPLSNHGNYIISLNKFVKWLAGLVEAEGIDLFTGFRRAGLLMDGDRVIGVRTGDRGIGKHGEQKPTFEPGVDIHAKVTIFADGVRGNLTKELLRRLPLAAGRQPQLFAIGIKELWDVPADRLAPGTVIHTMGYPLRFEEFGGGFIYAMPEGQLSVGFVVGLDYKDPMFDPHVAFNRFKQHPFVTGLLEGGQMVRYGAKALPEGGWNTHSALLHGRRVDRRRRRRLPELDAAEGHSPRDAHRGCWRRRRRSTRFAPATRPRRASSNSRRKVDGSPVRRELYPVRNVHQAFGHGLLAGLAFSGLALVDRRMVASPDLPAHAGYERMETLADYYRDAARSPTGRPAR